MWMLEKKGYKVEYADDSEAASEEEEAAEGEEEPDEEAKSEGGADIVQGVAIAADAIVAQEIEDMNDIDATELNDEWKDVTDTMNARDMLMRQDKLALRKYRAQKYFTDALTGEDVAFFEKHKKAILYRILQRDATASELFAKNKEEVECARRCGMEDVVSQDYKVRTALFKLIMNVGYKSFEDDTTEVCLKEAGESDEIKHGIDKVQKLVAGSTKKNRNITLAGVLKPWLLKCTWA
ncbi:unnamed protein product [Hapterophycus canaliculatus]